MVGESGVGTWTGFRVGLNSKGGRLWLIDSKLLVWGLHGVTKRIGCVVSQRCLMS